VLAPGIALARGRAPEATGPARSVLALLAAARLAGPVLWLGPARSAMQLLGDGLSDFLDPARLVLVRPRKPAGILWAAEEALRSGEAPLVVADLDRPPPLLAVRRLHLAAEAGTSTPAPLALLLTPDPGGAPGIETRWRLAPAPGWADEGAPRWRLTRALARMAPETSWDVAIADGRLLLGGEARSTAALREGGRQAQTRIGITT
jgi:protein ImuA